MALRSVKPWELQPGQSFVFRLDNYTTDFIAPGRPALGWTTVHAKSRDGLVTVLMIESDEDVQAVVARDYTAQIERGRREDSRGNLRRR